MPNVVIENPILNSPFREPTRHFRFDDDGITSDVVPSRRVSAYFVPIPRSKKKVKRGTTQLAFDDNEWTNDRIEENHDVNRIRSRVGLWREGGYPGVTPTTARLLEYWTNEEREKKLFFCQIEALETAIYMTEVAGRYGDAWMEGWLRDQNDLSNPGLSRRALKMATGTGKTVVMAMLIAWQALNKLANPQDARFSDAFLIIAPGITIRDRLQVLRPENPRNYYRERDIVSSEQIQLLQRAKFVITNFHAFQLREKVKVGKLNKTILVGPNEESPFKESPAEMVRRVCRELGNKKNIVVLNDEAHHCYRRKPDADEERLTGDDRKEAEKREEEARIWISGVEAVKAKLGIKAIYDLSATPFFLRGSGYPEGTLFPWVVSDFSLIDAIESGIVKVPRVPVSDNSMVGDEPTYRDLWLRIRDELPKKGRKTDAVSGEPKLPIELQGALHSLYSNYERSFRRWETSERDREGGSTPPVFIVVCNNTNVSKLVFDYIAGWEKPFGNETRVQKGELELFRNDDGEGDWRHRPFTILVDSQQLESGEQFSPEFKQVASREIEEFKQEYRERFPGRDASELTDEDLLREVMNSVGKRGRLGEHVRCVVSVSMLTEGWDANTVTHILGVRAFGTQLLCEQVVGRALRRMSYSLEENGHFALEYAEVYGIPFSFIPSSGSSNVIKPGAIPTRVRALESRIGAEITFPRLVGYRYELPDGPLKYLFTEDSKLALSTYDVPSQTEVAPMIGESAVHDLYDLKRHRQNTIAFELAKRTLDRYFSDPASASRPDEYRHNAPWLFPQLLKIAKEWMQTCVVLKDDAFIQMLMLTAYQHDAIDRIYRSIVGQENGIERLTPVLRPYESIGSTRYVDYDTTKPVWPTDPAKCHVTHVVADTDSWEQKTAQAIEEMPEVVRYVKNENVGFRIPYTINGIEREYIPDFIVCLDDGHGPDDLLHLIVEVTGEKKKEKAAKTATARDLWVPAVNNARVFGRWDFVEISDPWSAMKLIRDLVAARKATQVTAIP